MALQMCDFVFCPFVFSIFQFQESFFCAFLTFYTVMMLLLTRFNE
jgi:hypothetical protein